MAHTVVECPECEDRKLIDHTQDLAPSVWCSCDGFNKMETNPDAESTDGSVSKASREAYPDIDEPPGLEW